MLLWAPQALLALLLPVLLPQGEARRRGGLQAHNTSRPALWRLSDHLLTNYKKGVRPVRDWRRPTTISIDVIVYAILNVDEKNQVLTTYIWYRQYWTDEFLQWNPEDFDNITKLSIPTDSIWVPDILINEFVDVGKSPDIPYVYVQHHGEVQNYKPLQVVTACSLDIYNFPFDVQNCSLTFTSWLHTSGHPPAAPVLCGQPAAAQYLPHGHGHCGLLPAPREWGEGLLQDHTPPGLLSLPDHCV
uniref:5-hydroxytryptamine receptor 3A n=1 Tax=Pipistrellus kuhlii TaxID=59472 RepID=A0A7J7WZX9_PIPKU|nr:5-hydroxytryptamine receptor 3A [Pipistrellus kuhlii]